MYNAIYYEDGYLLLPEEFGGFGDFLRDLQEKKLPAQYRMVVLREEHNVPCFNVIKGRSMAPYFLSGYHDEPGLVTITDPAGVYPVQVEVLDQTEYNRRLREVINQVCPGCQRFKPLSNRVQSLNGHFEEMTLDGVCVFRQESKPAPRIFHHHLFSFGGFFKQFHYDTISAQEMHDNLKHWFYIRYDDAALEEEAGRKILVLRGKKNELLLPVLTDAISRYIDKISDSTYCIRLEEEYCYTENALNELFAEKNRDAFRKDCKKYGVSLAILKYDEHAAESVQRSLKPLIDHFWLFPLIRTGGKEYFLVADTAYVLKELRYRSPLLQAHHACIDVFGQYKNARYEISFEMKQIQL